MRLIYIMLPGIDYGSFILGLKSYNLSISWGSLNTPLQNLSHVGPSLYIQAKFNFDICNLWNLMRGECYCGGWLPLFWSELCTNWQYHYLDFSSCFPTIISWIPQRKLEISLMWILNMVFFSLVSSNNVQNYM